MECIKTGTGKTFNAKHCGALHDILYITIIGHTLPELVAVFSQPEESNSIKYFYNEDEDPVAKYNGYTVITDVSALDEEVRLALKNPNYFSELP